MHSRFRTPLLAAAAAFSAACSSGSTAPSATVVGKTPGWFNGSTVTFDYTKPFFCQSPPADSATTKCEIGAAAQVRPDSAGAPIPILFVMTPLGFTPPMATLHCPTVGNCVTHPTELDVSAVFGGSAGTWHFPLPAHSHIISDEAGHADVPWLITIIGVKDTTTWNSVVAGKSLTTVRSLQAADTAGVHITGDIPTNLFLFFKVE